MNEWRISNVYIVHYINRRTSTTGNYKIDIPITNNLKGGIRQRRNPLSTRMEYFVLLSCVHNERERESHNCILVTFEGKVKSTSGWLTLIALELALCFLENTCGKENVTPKTKGMVNFKQSPIRYTFSGRKCK